MPRLDHVHIHAVDGPRMVAFLEAVLEAEEGFRPPFAFPGHWVYVDGVPAIHISVAEDELPRGVINHAAFGVYEFEATRQRIEATGHAYRITGIPGTAIGQFFVDGPDGLLLEVQFHRAITD
jgi:catechol 2,3-dioxygenase-like lactoylglutathione lyase family enzyme